MGILQTFRKMTPKFAKKMYEQKQRAQEAKEVPELFTASWFDRKHKVLAMQVGDRFYETP